MATYKPLSTDFKDDILASQNSKRKYTQVNNSDGTVSFQDSTAYSQVGSSYGAKEIIEEREAINNIYANKLVTLDEIDLVTEPGFFVDAQVVKELNSNSIKNFISPDVDTEKLGCVEFFNGLKIVFGSVKCNYTNPNVLSGGAKFPVVFSQAPCFTTGVGNIGNTYDELSRNAKVKIYTTSINIALHDPSSKFSAGTYYYVNFVAIGV